MAIPPNIVEPFENGNIFFGNRGAPDLDIFLTANAGYKNIINNSAGSSMFVFYNENQAARNLVIHYEITIRSRNGEGVI